MTLDQLTALFSYWRRVPPTHELVASYFKLSIGPETKAPPGPTTEEGLKQLAAALGAAHG